MQQVNWRNFLPYEWPRMVVTLFAGAAVCICYQQVDWTRKEPTGTCTYYNYLLSFDPSTVEPIVIDFSLQRLTIRLRANGHVCSTKQTIISGECDRPTHILNKWGNHWPTTYSAYFPSISVHLSWTDLLGRPVDSLLCVRDGMKCRSPPVQWSQWPEKGTDKNNGQ